MIFMEFRILGSLDVLKDGVSLGVRAPREKALLAVLLLEANRVVPMSRLIDALWDGAPPETARNQVQICVSTLRRIFHLAGDRHVIKTRAPGYQMNTTGETVVDAIRFDALVADGRKAADEGRLQDAVNGLRTALGLWCGPAAAGIDSRVVQIAATRLNEKRLATIEACIGLELKLGNHAEAIGELATLVAEHPLREKLRAHHMLALYRAGRRAEALAAYREAWQVFMEELGLDPGQELRQLQKAILRTDPSLDLAGKPAETGAARTARRDARGPHAPCQLPVDIKDFSGREELTKQLRGVLATAEVATDPAPPRRLVVLTGMKGVGKTALAVHVAHQLRDHFPDGQLFLPLGGTSRPTAASQLARSSLRALGVPTDALPAESAEQGVMYRRLIAPRRVLIILDDAASAGQVMELLPGGHQCSVMVTSRRRLRSLFGAHSFEVGMLPPDAALEMLSRGLGDALPELARMAELCGFWPLVLRTVAAQLLEHQHKTLREIISRLEHDKDRIAELRWLADADPGKMAAAILPASKVRIEAQSHLPSSLSAAPDLRMRS